MLTIKVHFLLSGRHGWFASRHFVTLALKKMDPSRTIGLVWVGGMKDGFRAGLDGHLKPVALAN